MIALAAALAVTVVPVPARGDPTLTSLERALVQEGRVAVYLPFDFGGARIEKAGEPEIARIADALKKKPALKLVVEGHANSFATPEENMALSEARAQAVVAALAKLGVAAGRLSYSAKGDEQPLTDETRLALPRERNERIELVDPDFKGVRIARAIEATDAEGSKEPVFRRVPSYYISSFEEYDSWKGGRLARASGVDLEGRAKLVTYRHPDADRPGARLPTAEQILDQYRSAARQSGGYLVHISSFDALYKLSGAPGETWIGVEVPSPAQYRVLVVTKTER